MQLPNDALPIPLFGAKLFVTLSEGKDCSSPIHCGRDQIVERGVLLTNWKNGCIRPAAEHQILADVKENMSSMSGKGLPNYMAFHTAEIRFEEREVNKLPAILLQRNLLSRSHGLKGKKVI